MPKEKLKKLSRSKLELFTDCPRCFWMDQKAGIKRPDFPAFTLNSAVDHLLKKEFDIHRAKKEPHPLIKKYGVDAIPYQHENLDKWRHNFTGIQFFHEETEILVYGAIDDVWENSNEELHIVDYKSTAKDTDPNLDGPWQQSYKRQMEIYQWLFRQNGFTVSNTGYFVYVNGKRDRKAFDGKLEFDVHLIPYEGKDNWVEKCVVNAKECLDTDDAPKSSPNCRYCAYIENASQIN